MPRCGYMDMAATPRLYVLLLTTFGMAAGPDVDAVMQITADGTKDVVCCCWLAGWDECQSGSRGLGRTSVVVVGWLVWD